jgi:hypothetical protein
MPIFPRPRPAAAPPPAEPAGADLVLEIPVGEFDRLIRTARWHGSRELVDQLLDARNSARRHRPTTS